MIKFEDYVARWLYKNRAELIFFPHRLLSMMDRRLSSDEILHHLAYHIFLPPELPQAQLGREAEQQVSLQITRSVIDAVAKHKKNDSDNAIQWDRITRMLEHIFTSIEVPLEQEQLSQDMTNLGVSGKGGLQLSFT